MMWIIVIFSALVCFSETQAGGRRPSHPEKDKVSLSPPLSDNRDFFTTCCATEKPKVSPIANCENVLDYCQNNPPWTRCYEREIATCQPRRRGFPFFIQLRVNLSQEAMASPTPKHSVHIPSSALQRSRGAALEDEVLLVATVIDSSYFKVTNNTIRSRGFMPTRIDGSVMGGFVLVVKAGDQEVSDLSEPIRLIFTHVGQVNGGTCVYWHEKSHGDGTGYWSSFGCETNSTGSEFICSCNHMSFFAVLVNPEISVDKKTADNLSYITYIGSALSVIFAAIGLIIFICLQRHRPEKAIGLHMQLTGALLLLHLSFLLSCLWVWLMENKAEGEGWVCQSLGFLLHWSFLATLTWTALEGFHLYLLLVRVFNIYVRRYVLKLSALGWGLPTLTAVICVLCGVNGKLDLFDKNSQNPTLVASLCWIRREQVVVAYITSLALLCVVILGNSCMLGVVVFKLWGLRRSVEGSVGWQKMNKEKVSRLWKDCATVLGLSWMLGLPWALLSTTYIQPVFGAYAFTVFNTLQGVFVFLWSIALSRKSRSENSSSFKDPSTSQKMMTTSFNN